MSFFPRYVAPPRWVDVSCVDCHHLACENKKTPRPVRHSCLARCVTCQLAAPEPDPTRNRA